MDQNLEKLQRAKSLVLEVASDPVFKTYIAADGVLSEAVIGINKVIFHLRENFQSE